MRTRALHARNMFDSVLGATGINDPALLSVTGLARPVLLRSLSCSSVRSSAAAAPSGLECPIRVP